MPVARRLFVFSPLERMIAWRYLRPRRKEGFVSVIAAFSFLGIMLGVATLIVVMAVLNGFRAELLDMILGFQGHVSVYHADTSPLHGYARAFTKAGSSIGPGVRITERFIAIGFVITTLNHPAPAETAPLRRHPA